MTVPLHVFRAAVWVALTLAAASGCAAQDPSGASRASPSPAPTSASPAAKQATGLPFEGEWSVEWCDKAKPDQECGGFNLSLVQRGDQLCGAYDSARAGLAQVDEGGRVSGTVENGVAQLTIESERSGGQYAATARPKDNRLHWKLGETLRKANQDIDLIAIDDALVRRPVSAEVTAKHEQTARDCHTQWSAK